MLWLFAAHDTPGGKAEVVHRDSQNIWLGPSHHNLIKLGTMFGPCMRMDKSITIQIATYAHMNPYSELGCCEIHGKGAGNICYICMTVHPLLLGLYVGVR